jgi:hypothetical protein
VPDAQGRAESGGVQGAGVKLKGHHFELPWSPRLISLSRHAIPLPQN